jgi:hypothetical protein
MSAGKSSANPDSGSSAAMIAISSFMVLLLTVPLFERKNISAHRMQHNPHYAHNKGCFASSRSIPYKRTGGREFPSAGKKV